MRRLAIVLSLFCFSSASAAAEWKQIPTVRLHATQEVAAPAAAVWSYLTAGRNLVTWCPEWKSPRNASVDLKKVGDVLDYSDAWGNGGRSIVTYYSAGRELRVTHEPSKGDYMCQGKFVLEPSAHGTVVHLYEEYTDESSATDLKATADKMQNELSATLATVKKGVEKH